MRVAFVNSLYPPYGASGAETTLRFLASSLRDRGHECVVVTLAPPGEAGGAGEVDGISVRYLPLANVYWPHADHRPKHLRPIFQALDAYNPIMARRLRAVLAELRPDVVHCHNLQGFSVSAWTAAKRLALPVVQTMHDYYTGCPRSAMWRPSRGNCVKPCGDCRAFAAPRRALSYIPDVVTCVSHRVLDRVMAAGVFTGRPARVIRGNNPSSDVAVADLQPRPAGAPLRLGFMGRLDPMKGLEILLEAVAAQPSPGSVSLSIAGRGDDAYVRTLHGLAARSPVKVEFVGHVRPADFFPTLDLLAVPSIWEDPFPRVFHEALAYGVPSLVSPLGGLPEVISHGRNGFITAEATAESYRASIATLAREGWDRSAVRLACLAAASAYAPAAIVGQYESVLAAAAARSPIPENAGEVWGAAQVAAPSPL